MQEKKQVKKNGARAQHPPYVNVKTRASGINETAFQEREHRSRGVEREDLKNCIFFCSPFLIVNFSALSLVSVSLVRLGRPTPKPFQRSMK